TQNEAVAHDRADRLAPPGGAFTTRQVLPFQASASEDPAATPASPTAMQKETLVHETASRKPATLALRRTRQLAPFHTSASTKSLPAGLRRPPTAMQNEPLTHETPYRLSRVAGPVALPLISGTVPLPSWLVTEVVLVRGSAATFGGPLPTGIAAATPVPARAVPRAAAVVAAAAAGTSTAAATIVKTTAC